MNADLAALVHRLVIPALWCAWALYWWATSRDVKTTTRREPFLSRAGHIGPMVVAAALLWSPRLAVLGLDGRFMPWAPWESVAGVVVTAGGLGFAVWARRHIGRNWSAIVTLKEDHELVTTGPYALVRHPIYTGLLFGFLGSAIALGQWRGLLAVAIVYVALLRKYRLEERWMHERFGTAYDAYRARVRALVPFLF
ncbi:MAG: isoprenylcysteine carboxylmethyltransferase family protein [Betaproteobacteria bacterium]